MNFKWLVRAGGLWGRAIGRIVEGANSPIFVNFFLRQLTSINTLTNCQLSHHKTSKLASEDSTMAANYASPAWAHGGGGEVPQNVPAQKLVNIDVGEFVRTRDAVSTISKFIT